MHSSVTVQQDESGLATVCIDRPQRRNALSRDVMTALIERIEALSVWPSLRVMVLTGTGGKAFIGGADIDEMSRVDQTSARTFITQVHRCCRALVDCPVPVIARIDGHALGAGLEIAAACDLRIASDRSFFGMPEVRLGIPSVVEAALLPRLIGAGRARWLVYTGESIDARRALDWGLVEEVVPAVELDAALARTVGLLLTNGNQALRLQKRLCRSWDEQPLTEAIDGSIDLFVSAFSTGEGHQRLLAYLDAHGRRR